MHPGFNHNIKYKGRIFHIQTEDSGLKNPHIITHLFVGGNIIETIKSDYKHIIAAGGEFSGKIVELMKNQHKEMMRRLINGMMDLKLGLSRQEITPVNSSPLEERAELLSDEDDGELFLGVISEKSLDEVILSFLSEEEAKKPK
ncbi:MAG: hypothetical protein Kow0090_14220 [Myxococcota bacterium]